MRLERETFGPVLRAARERRRISLPELAADTKVSVDLWTDLEENDFSRWPGRLYARTYIRDYATRVGLDPETIVNEFCRLFPEQGDRRAEGLLRAHAAIVQHTLEWQDEPPPSRRERRATDRDLAKAGVVSRHVARILTIGLDVKITLAVSATAGILDLPFWPSFAVVTGLYHAAGVFVCGRSFGAVLGDWCLKMSRSRPAARRLVSSRAQTS